MDEEKETEEQQHPMIGVTLIIIVMIVFAVVFWQVASQFDTYEYDRLREEIDNKTNVSSDYRQGWLDCIAKLKSIRTEMSNVTNQFS